MSVSTLIGFSSYLFALLILSAFVKLSIVGVSYIRFHLQKDEEDFYDERFARLAEDALNGPLLLTDQRGSDEQARPADPKPRPKMAPVSSHLSDPFERKFA